MIKRGSILAFALMIGLGAGCRQVTTRSASTLSPSGASPVTNGGSMTAKIDPNCMTGNYDACIFMKNPVAQRGSPFPSVVTNITDLRAYQTYGVPISGLDNSGFLQNASFRVIPGTVARVVRAQDGTWRYPYSNCAASGVCSRDNVHRVSQVMAYYWLNFQSDEMESRTGAYFAQNRNIQVDPFAPGYPNAHWDFVNNEIVMGEINQQDLALSAEIYLHEAGHANVHFATMSAINGASPNDVGCGQSGFDSCCQTFRGCIGAINEGQADYHAAMIFPSSTALGDSLENDTSGFFECGLPRSIPPNQNLLATTAYNACGGTLRGEIHVTGRIYASIWFELRRATGVIATQIDTLFTEHLRTLAASDTFETAGTKIIAADNALFGGAHVAAIRAEFTRRGLTVP